jgi:ELWxxDGT repeat protein
MRRSNDCQWLPASLSRLGVLFLLALTASPLFGQPSYLVKDINPGSSWSNIRNMTAGPPGKVFFVAEHPSSGREVWVSDGTDAGTLVLDICPGTCNSLLSGSNPWFALVNATMFFSVNHGTNGTELWKSDGTVSGTLVKDIDPGTDSSFPDS